ncbi:septum site-determining protein Ssd [Saccharopolyspora rosea]|uniref:Septum site-determining protein Ssd n=1 Tax=Saccharopolyspora rosea TaxID=524884 RepID=A0ABW3FSP5_9PSEU|nr:septum site-determining protein Ssd [Saccharopolyspora rosea]
MSGPMLFTSDSELAEEVLRLAAASGCELVHVTDPSSAEGMWRCAPVVLLDRGTAEFGMASGLPRRPGVLVVCRATTEQLWRSAFGVGAEHVVALPEQESQLIDVLTDALHGPPRRDGRVLAVLGGRGGAGASVLATATAVRAARRGDRALLVDCDPMGGGLDLATGTEDVDGARWSGLAVGAGRLVASALHDALPARRFGAGALSVLSCDRDGPSTGLTPESVRTVVGTGRRAGDTVVCDLPRALPEPATAALRHADLVVVVVPAEVRSCAAAARTVASVAERTAAPVRLVVRGPATSGLGVADVREAVGAQVLTAMRAQPGLAEAVDRAGFPALRPGSRGVLTRVAARVLDELDACESAVDEWRPLSTVGGG